MEYINYKKLKNLKSKGLAEEPAAGAGRALAQLLYSCSSSTYYTFAAAAAAEHVDDVDAYVDVPLDCAGA